MSEVDELYVMARRVLLDALDALGRTEEANALRERYGLTEQGERNDCIGGDR